MDHPAQYRGKQVVVLGLAKSGLAVAKLFHRLGAVVTVNDIKERSLCPEADELEALGISVVCGSHPDTLIHPGVSLVVKNPGIPYTIAPVRQAVNCGVEIVTEVEVAARVCRAPIIGVTGSNGKTTTTVWIGRMLSEGGLAPIVAGNIGRPLCDVAEEAGEGDWVVAELSSFQLKGVDRFRPRIACLLNVCEAHLDYHGTMEDYVESKAKLFANQTEEDVAVLNWDDPTCRRLAERVRARVIPYSSKERLPSGIYVDPPISGGEPLNDGHRIVFRDEAGRETAIIPAKRLGVPGKHNVENGMAAAAAALATGVGADAIARALENFRGVEHRLEFVREWNGIAFYNNSKATNPQATITALQSFEQPVVLLAGGLDRQIGFDDMIPHLARNVKAVVAFGQTREKIAEIAERAGIGMIKTVDNANSAAETLDLAVRLAAGFAKAGDIVLLSPACASWDMFASYEERGRMFKESVHNL